MNIRRVLKHYLQESRLNHLAPFNTCCTSRRPILKSHAAHGPIRSTPRCMRSNLWSIREKTSAIAWGQMAKHLQGKHTHPSKFSSHHPNSAAKVGKLKSKWLWNSKSCSRRAWPWPGRRQAPQWVAGSWCHTWSPWGTWAVPEQLKSKQIMMCRKKLLKSKPTSSFGKPKYKPPLGFWPRSWPSNPTPLILTLILVGKYMLMIPVFFGTVFPLPVFAEAPVNELDGALGLDRSHSRVDVLWHHVAWFICQIPS